MQIMECCYYLNHTNLDKNNGAKKEDDSNFVRLLTGSRALSGMVDITDVNVPKDKSAKQAQFSMSVVKKSTGKWNATSNIFFSAVGMKTKIGIWSNYFET